MMTGKFNRRQFLREGVGGATLAIAGPTVASDSSSVASGQTETKPSSVKKRYSLQNKFGVSVSVEPDIGRYYVTYQGESWFGTGIVSVLAENRWYRSADVKYPDAAAYSQPSRRLILNDVKSSSQNDQFGRFDSLALSWAVPVGGRELVTEFKLYENNPYLVFVQKFPNGFTKYASGNWIIPSVVFPQFIPAFDFGGRKDLYSWTSGGMFTHRFAYGNASSLGGTVDLLLLADTEYKTVILSPFANYLVAAQQCSPVASVDETNPQKEAINCGIEGLVEDVPPGFEHQHLMVVGQGISKTFINWGKVLLERAGKAYPSKYMGDTMKYPVYWDDYGSYYQTHGLKEEGYRSYEDIILGLDEDAKKHGLRIAAYELDEDDLLDHEGLFEPKKDLFPHGLEWLHEKLGKSFEAYYCWLAPKGPYPKEYKHFATPRGRTPGASMGDVYYTADYWEYTAEKVSKWGAILFQHDFQSVYEGDPVMMAGIDRMDTYFKNMAKALQAKGINMQYCMQLPRNIMQSSENPTMIGLQGSWDHHVYWAEPEKRHQDDDPYVWKHLIFTSAFYGALGIWPSRDNIRTTADPNAWEDVLIANLLGGEIQLGHRIGHCDFDLVRKTYREGDCLILKPDKPIRPLDRCYVEGGVVGYTESNHNGKAWYYVLSLPPSGYLPNFSASDLGATGRWAIYDYGTGVVSINESTNKVNLRREAKHEYFVLAPILENGMAVIGDAEKFVTMGDMRTASVEASLKALRVGVISGQTWNPIIVGYSSGRPARVQQDNLDLDEISSLSGLRRQRAGWFWDPCTKLWHVKLDFSSASGMETRWFSIS
jgi:hypothetical protein